MDLTFLLIIIWLVAIDLKLSSIWIILLPTYNWKAQFIGSRTCLTRHELKHVLEPLELNIGRLEFKSKIFSSSAHLLIKKFQASFSRAKLRIARELFGSCTNLCKPVFVKHFPKLDLFMKHSPMPRPPVSWKRGSCLNWFLACRLKFMTLCMLLVLQILYICLLSISYIVQPKFNFKLWLCAHHSAFPRRV